MLLARQVFRHIDHNDAGSQTQRRFKAGGSLIVQQVFPAVDDHIVRQQNAQRDIGVPFLNGIDVGKQGRYRGDG